MQAVAVAALLLFSSVVSAVEPEPVTVLEKYGPVIDRAEAAELGLFKYRQNFGALRFVRADSGRFEARLASRVGGVMLEQAVPLDSLGLTRVEQGLFMLRDRSATNVELLLSSPYALDTHCLGPTTDIRAATGAVCFGLLGLGVGMVMGTGVTWDEERYEMGWPEWRKKNLRVTAAIAAATTLAGGFGGWYAGSGADAGRPAQPRPRCAIAGYDDYGYPFYEEQVRAMQGGTNSMLYAVGGVAIGSIVAPIAGGIANSRVRWMTSVNDPNGLGMGPVAVMDIGIIVTVAYLANTIGRDMDRGIALEKLRNRPRPENSH